MDHGLLVSLEEEEEEKERKMGELTVFVGLGVGLGLGKNAIVPNLREQEKQTMVEKA